MKILIVSGFLGAGKTTFIKELLRRTGVRAVVMENEYGENNIDARDLKESGTGNLEVLEFMEGCVCCSMKDSFVNSVITVSTGLDPDYLIVEPTGVGRLSNILENLKPILYDRISLLKPVVILSPGAYRRNMSEWPDLYRDQVAAAETIVFSKSERESPEVLADTEKLIRKINPFASVIREHYFRMPDSWWKKLLEDGPVGTAGQAPEPYQESGTEGERGQAGLGMTSLTLKKASLQNPAQLALLLEDCIRGVFGHVARAKGNIPVGGEMLRFDLADRLYAISGSSEIIPQCVFIGVSLDKHRIAERLGTSLAGKRRALPLDNSAKGKILPLRKGPVKRSGKK